MMDESVWFLVLRGQDMDNDRPLYDVFFATAELAKEAADDLNQDAIKIYNKRLKANKDRAIEKYDKAVKEHKALVEAGLRESEYPYERPAEHTWINHAGLFGPSYTIGSAPLRTTSEHE